MKRIILSILGISTIATASAVVGGLPTTSISQQKAKTALKGSGNYEFFFNYGNGVNSVEFYNTHVEEGCYQGIAQSDHGNGHLHTSIPVAGCPASNQAFIKTELEKWLVKDHDLNRPVNWGTVYVPKGRDLIGLYTKMTAKDALSVSNVVGDILVTGKLYINGSPINGDLALWHMLLPDATYHYGNGYIDSAWAWSVRNDSTNVTFGEICADPKNYLCDKYKTLPKLGTPFNIDMTRLKNLVYATYEVKDHPAPYSPQTSLGASMFGSSYNVHQVQFNSGNNIDVSSYSGVTITTEDGSRYLMTPAYDAYSVIISKY
ncbi:MAG: hypothetical protein PHC75_02610 [Burkholderiales bacterium]|nr:hypothetical protein [Burkholderiales bacterium]